MNRPRPAAHWATTLLLCGALGACHPRSLDSVSPDPAKPWSGPAGNGGFSVPANPEAAAGLAPTPGLPRGGRSGLAELIDIAQTENPETRVAWQRARQAAIASGMVSSTYLPLLSANIVAGYQDVTTSLPLRVLGQDDVTTSVSGVSPQLVLQWLVFDFGQRDALHEGARRNAFGANVLFNAVHQTIIHNVTRAYLLYNAARGRVRIAEQTLANGRKIEAAADARTQKGFGTTVETAQARQGTAQARFALVQAQGAERDAYQALLRAMGVSPLTVIEVREPGGQDLPPDVGAPTEEAIKAALARRPDVLAAFSALKASEAGITAAQAAFWPKVYLAAIAAGGTNNLNASGLPTIGQQSSARGVILGATMPIFDGGLRSQQLEHAKSLAAASQAAFQRTRDDAAREIVVAANTLHAALAAYEAATALTRAAATTHDAAFDAYRAGIGDVTAATAAETGLLAARLAQLDASAAARIAAANLAFVLGNLTSAGAAVNAVQN